MRRTMSPLGTTTLSPINSRSHALRERPSAQRRRPDVGRRRAEASLRFSQHEGRIDDYAGRGSCVVVVFCRLDAYGLRGRGLHRRIGGSEGTDPVEFRLGLIKDHPRHAATLNSVRKGRLGSPPPAGRFRGVAIAESFNTVMAEIAEISVENDNRKCIALFVLSIAASPLFPQCPGADGGRHRLWARGDPEIEVDAGQGQGCRRQF